MAKKYKYVIHSNACKKLVRLFRKLKTERAVSRAINVNPRYVHDNLIKGIEPPDTTLKYQEVREKLFLQRKKRKAKIDKPRKIKPDFIVQWDHLPTEERHKVIKEYLNGK